MGKEAKIGLAIVGVLLLVFAALLVRRFVPFEAVMADTSPAADDPAAPNFGGVEPRILTVQKDSGEHAPSDREARVPSRQAESTVESPEDMPRRGFMPRDAAPAGGESSERDRRDDPPVADSDDVPSATSDPFHGASARRSAQADAGAPRELDIVPQDASSLDDRQPRGGVSGNTLRRLSADLSADEVPAADEPPSAARVEGELNTIEVPSPGGDSTALPLESNVPAEPPADPTSPRVPVDASTRPRSRYQEPAEAPLAEPRQLVENGKYTIQPNDSLWLISEKVYGTGRYFKAIYQHNRNKLPRADQLTVGAVIAVPAASVLEENYPALCPKQRKSVVVQPRSAQASTRPPAARGGDVYVVEAGDTLFDIARYELGKASRWGEIYDLNREVLGEDFDYLQPGTQLRMPPHGGRGDAVTRQPDAAYQR